MLSILIPTYNYSIFSLVSAIHSQIEKTEIPFEIICLDDASTLFLIENERINLLNHTKYEVLDFNIGRSKIRNLLAKKAKFDWLLFLDADVIPKNDNFISEYEKYINEEVKIVNGGLIYQSERPKKSKLLRWVYGKNREALPFEIRCKNPYLSFLTLNFLMHKTIFKEVSFNETIPNLRHEDTLFSFNLMEKNFKIIHINNPIVHLGLDDFDIAIKKEKESLLGLKYLIDHNLISVDYLKIAKLFSNIKKLKLTFVFSFFYKLSNKTFLMNLSSNNPSLFIFDLYRLSYLCFISKK